MKTEVFMARERWNAAQDAARTAKRNWFCFFLLVFHSKLLLAWMEKLTLPSSRGSKGLWKDSVSHGAGF